MWIGLLQIIPLVDLYEFTFQSYKSHLTLDFLYNKVLFEFTFEDCFSSSHTSCSAVPRCMRAIITSKAISDAGVITSLLRKSTYHISTCIFQLILGICGSL